MSITMSGQQLISDSANLLESPLTEEWSSSEDNNEIDEDGKQNVTVKGKKTNKSKKYRLESDKLDRSDFLTNNPPPVIKKTSKPSG